MRRWPACAKHGESTKKGAPRGAFFVASSVAYFATTRTISRHLFE